MWVKIRVNPKIVEPCHAWGSSVTHASIGVVTNVCGVRECYIDFPEHLGWKAMIAEMQVFVGKKILRRSNYAKVVLEISFGCLCSWSCRS
jgi:hypothetical protein